MINRSGFRARAIAALSIVYYHSWTSIVRFPKDSAYQIPGLTTYGWFAVYLFFAISGYVICLVVSRETFRVPSFLIKRLFRLYPLWLRVVFHLRVHRVALARVSTF